MRDPHRRVGSRVATRDVTDRRGSAVSSATGHGTMGMPATSTARSRQIQHTEVRIAEHTRLRREDCDDGGRIRLAIRLRSAHTGSASGEYPQEVDPVACRMAGEPGSARHGRNRLAIDLTWAHTLRCLGQAPEEVDPVAHPLAGEPGSARQGRCSVTRPTTGCASMRHVPPAPYAQATASATHKRGSDSPSTWSKTRVGCLARDRMIVVVSS
jgi:hypothetical protein